MDHYVHDYETLSNCFVAIFIHYKTDETKIFVVHELRDDFDELVTFLEGNVKNKEWHISFNGLAFDSQITHYILEHKKILKQFTSEVIATKLYAYAQKVINKQNDRGFSDYPAWKMKINQIDLFKMNHYDNMAKLSSLKWLQYSMDWENVLEMPIHHTSTINTIKEIDEIIYYCINDVKSTKELMNRCMGQINLRQTLTKEYNVNLYSASEPKIAKEIFSYFLTRKLDIDAKDLKQMRTPRDEITLKDCILPQIKFETPLFQSVLDYFNSKVVKEIKGAVSYKIKDRGVDIDYGLGGIHGATKCGIYEAKEGYTIMTSDVSSFYPNLAIKNKFAPAHLPLDAFLEQYEWFYEERKLIPKSNPKNYVFKLILNSSYGLSNEPNSFLYDPMMTLQITINGELWLSKLYEMLTLAIPDITPIMLNTDGLEMMIPSIDKVRYLEVCREWEELTNLQLEHDEYSKIILKDVNNYVSIYKNGKTKCKGLFEFQDLALHKNKSFLIIPKAIYAYFINGTKPETYLEQNQNIYDYCGAVKSKGDWWLETRRIVNDVAEKFKHMTIEEKRNYLLKNGWIPSIIDVWFKVDDNTKLTTEEAFESCIYKEATIEKIKLQKIVRYYISNTGEKIIKVNKDGRIIQVEAGKWRQTICNNITPILNTPFDKLNINTKYYLEKIYKEIENITTISTDNYVQGTLF